jgi:TPR repeat protein
MVISKWMAVALTALLVLVAGCERRLTANQHLERAFELMELGELGQAVHHARHASGYGVVGARALLDHLLLTEDPHASLVLLNQAADQGHVDASFHLGYLAFTARRYEESLYRLSHAARHGHPRAQYLLSLHYQRGLATEPDPVRAVYWLMEAAGNGHEEARRQVRIMRAQGLLD